MTRVPFAALLFVAACSPSAQHAYESSVVDDGCGSSPADTRFWLAPSCAAAEALDGESRNCDDGSVHLTLSWKAPATPTKSVNCPLDLDTGAFWCPRQEQDDVAFSWEGQLGQEIDLLYAEYAGDDVLCETDLTLAASERQERETPVLDAGQDVLDTAGRIAGFIVLAPILILVLVLIWAS